MAEYTNNGIKCSCTRVQKGERIYYTCKSELDNITYGAYDIDKALSMLGFHIEKEIKKSGNNRVLFPPDENEVRVDEEYDKYYDEVMETLKSQYCKDAPMQVKGVGLMLVKMCKCPFEEGRKSELYPYWVLHLENNHANELEDIVNELIKVKVNPLSDLRLKEKLDRNKANYKNGDDAINIEYVEYARAKPALTKPNTPDLTPLNGKRVEENEEEEGDNYNYMRENRKAETHKYGGGTGVKRKKGRSQYYLSEKANFGNYSEKEKAKSKKNKDGRKMGYDYAEFFDSDGIPDKSVKKIVDDNRSTVIPGQTVPQYSRNASKNPAVQMSRGKKLKSKKKQLVDDSPKILGVDQAAGFAH